MLKKEYEILQAFVKEPWKEISSREIKEFTGKKSESYVYGVIKKFIAEKIITGKKIGGCVVYSLNIKDVKTRVYSGFVAEYIGWNSKIPFDGIKKIMLNVPSYFFIVLVGGSYAKSKQTKKSDIDVVIISDDCSSPKKIYAELRHLCEVNIPPIHLYVFTKSEFIKMILDKKANYGKEIIKNNLVLHGGEIYFSILSEAIENGFRS